MGNKFFPSSNFWSSAGEGSARQTSFPADEVDLPISRLTRDDTFGVHRALYSTDGTYHTFATSLWFPDSSSSDVGWAGAPPFVAPSSCSTSSSSSGSEDNILFRKASAKAKKRENGWPVFGPRIGMEADDIAEDMIRDI